MIKEKGSTEKRIEQHKVPQAPLLHIARKRKDKVKRKVRQKNE